MELDTITSISTPMGEGAIAIVRLSGPDAISIADSIYKGKNNYQKSIHIRLITDIFWILTVAKLLKK